ncbi:phage tail protein [Streptomyces sp. FIT100]|uniref:phage tail protein n=1 Tax=Streptomyces sp. FIT100 TaxID=2837956 RepID=UPI0021C66D69|nr:phage tail protein [Streptomyces sp. FIT100]UUN30788.1 phage tail protein [Streptomyces sp. FIT100]
MTDQPFAVSSMFQLTIGVHNLGSFTSCDGLGCSTEVEEHREGGLNDHVWQLPGRLRYTPLTLSRPLTRQTTLIWLWLSQVNYSLKPIRLPGQLVALGPDRRPLVRWALDGVVPVRWTGPSFSADQAQAASETLEIAHNGFLEVTV